jgi:hypothetical protein
MKSFTLFALIIFCPIITTTAQETNPEQLNKTDNKGKFFAYWGWSREWFSTSDIHFKGADYNFTLNNVSARDKPNKIGYDPYLKLGEMTIPQFNFRIGYFINSHYNISIGVDHMKYVVIQHQTTQITGSIANSNTIYDGIYNHENIEITDGFLLFEHTNGLNYINSEIRRQDKVTSISKNIAINFTEGLGLGALYPKTNTTLLNKQRYDEFHLAGYGVHALVGFNIQFFNFFFLQSEFKGGYINMPDIRTTLSSQDSASQHFFFTQFNWVFGAKFGVF